MRFRTVRRSLLAAACLLAFSATEAAAWNIRGHFRVARAAALAQPDEVPSFFRWGAEAVGHSAVDPDVMKARDTPWIRHREFPEHFLDYELVAHFELPERRYEFVQRMITDDLDPSRVGFVPYAVIENMERLSLAFAEHRCWPDDPHVRAKTLVYAGILGHYAGDMVQPLHTTIHFNGRARADGSSPGTGFHGKVDGLFEVTGFEAGDRPRELAVFADPWAAVRAEFAASFARVDALYALEPKIERLYEEAVWAPEVAAFSADRYARAVDFLGSLYWTAWRRSADLSLAGWLRRIGPGGIVVACGDEGRGAD